MDAITAIKNRRTVRKFTQEEIPNEKLVELVNLARLAPYGANVQPLKYVIIQEKSLRDRIFPHTKWAGYIKEEFPKDGETPTAYILILGDKNIKKSFEIDAGASATNMLIGAEAMGIGACWLGSIDRPKITKILNLSNDFDVLYMVAFGYPMQKSKCVDIVNNDVKYYFDDDGVLNVPKRTLDEVLIKNV